MFGDTSANQQSQQRRRRCSSHHQRRAGQKQEQSSNNLSFTLPKLSALDSKLLLLVGIAKNSSHWGARLFIQLIIISSFLSSSCVYYISSSLSTSCKGTNIDWTIRRVGDVQFSKKVSDPRTLLWSRRRLVTIIIAAAQKYQSLLSASLGKQTF